MTTRGTKVEIMGFKGSCRAFFVFVVFMSRAVIYFVCSFIVSHCYFSNSLPYFCTFTKGNDNIHFILSIFKRKLNESIFAEALFYRFFIVDILHFCTFSVRLVISVCVSSKYSVLFVSQLISIPRVYRYS